MENLIVVGAVDEDYERKIYTKEDKKYAEVAWRVEDILFEAQGIGIDLSIEEAEDILESKKNVIRDAMLWAGWKAIETILYDLKDDEEDE